MTGVIVAPQSDNTKESWLVDLQVRLNCETIFSMNKRTAKLQGRRIAGTYGRTAKKAAKRIANKATRKERVIV